MSEFFFPKQDHNFEAFSNKAIELVKSIRHKLLRDSSKLNQSAVVRLIREIRLSDLINERGKISIAYNSLRIQNKRRIKDLNNRDVNSLSHFINRDILDQIVRAANVRIPQVETNHDYSLENKGKFIDISKESSKSIRCAISPSEPLCVHKFGTILTPAEAIQWGHNLKRLTSVRNRNTILRVAHGDIYTKAKLFRYSLEDNPLCPRCGQYEDLEHKFVTCDYVQRIWNIIFNVTCPNMTPDTPIENKILGALTGATPVLVTIHSEILLRILMLRSDQDYLLRPSHFARLAITKILNCEKDHKVKNEVKSLLDRLM